MRHFRLALLASLLSVAGAHPQPWLVRGTVLDAASGQVLWTVNLLERFGARNIGWGISESPLVLEDRVLVSPGSRRVGFAAFDRESGELLWGTEGDEAGYASPLPVDLEGAPAGQGGA